jgi:hypothetical protein
MDRILEFAGNHPLLVSALMASFFLVVFYELRRKASGTINIEAIDAVKLINNDAVIIDLRSADAYACATRAYRQRGRSILCGKKVLRASMVSRAA